MHVCVGPITPFLPKPQLSFASLSDVIVPHGDTEGAAYHKSSLDDSMHDRWGFLVPPEYRQQRLTLRSYHEASGHSYACTGRMRFSA